MSDSGSSTFQVKISGSPSSPEKKIVFTDYHKLCVRILDISFKTGSNSCVQKISSLDHQCDQANVESVIYERLSLEKEDTCLEYCLGSMKRLNDMIGTYLSKQRREKREKVLVKLKSRLSDLQHIKNTLLRCIGMILFDIELFPQKNNYLRTKGASKEFLQKLISPDEYSEKSLFSILESLLKLYESDEDSLKRIFQPFLFELRLRMTFAKITDEKSYTKELEIFEWIACQPPLRNIIVNLPTFIPYSTLPFPSGRQIEKDSFLGPFLSLHGFTDIVNHNVQVLNSLFGQVSTTGMTVQQVESVFQVVRTRLKSVMNSLTRSFKNFMRDVSTRDSILKFFAIALSSNEDKSKLMSRSNLVSSDGFVLNLNYLMLCLCKPFMNDVTKKFYKKVEPMYCLCSRANFSGKTRFAIHTEEEVEKKYEELLLEKKKKDEDICKNSSLVTQMYYLTMKATHLGLLSSLRKFRNVLSSVSNHRAQLTQLSRLGSPDAARVRGTLMELIKIQYSNELHLVDRNFNELASKLYVFNCVVLKWKMFGCPTDETDTINILNLDRSKKMREFATLENPQNPPFHFASTPEFFLCDMNEHFMGLHGAVIRRRKGIDRVYLSTEWKYYCEVMILIGLRKDYYGNTNERSKFTEIFLYLAPIEESIIGRNSDLRRMSETLKYLPLAKNFLMQVLVLLYVDVEQMENSYYLKHKPRHEIGVLFEKFWSISEFQKSFVSVMRDTKKFMSFFNMHINDCTYLLDGCIEKLKAIHGAETVLDTPEELKKLSRQQVSELMRNRESDRQRVTREMSLTEVTINMLNFITRDIAPFFNIPGLIDRVANMLNHFLFTMVQTPKELVVKDREKLNFKPKILLLGITDIYLNLSKLESFCTAVARDQRSFRPEILRKACTLLQTRVTVKGEVYVENFSLFSEKVLKIHRNNPLDVIGEINVPEEFLDPLLDEVMEDPVMLPSSRQVMDRKNIVRHLLNTQKDPYTRADLTEDMLIPQPELKKKIQEFLKKNMKQ